MGEESKRVIMDIIKKGNKRKKEIRISEGKYLYKGRY